MQVPSHGQAQSDPHGHEYRGFAVTSEDRIGGASHLCARVCVRVPCTSCTAHYAVAAVCPPPPPDVHCCCPVAATAGALAQYYDLGYMSMRTALYRLATLEQRDGFRW